MFVFPGRSVVWLARLLWEQEAVSSNLTIPTISNYMNKHERPECYRITFRSGNWVTKSTRYYNVYHSSEAFEDIYYTFQTGGIHSRRITIYAIDEFNRFTGEWEERSGKALEHADHARLDRECISIKDGNKIVVRRDKKS